MTIKQVNVQVQEELAEGYFRFCREQGISPYNLLVTIISFYGRGQLVKELVDKGEITPDEAFIELGKIMTDAKKMAKANGEFQAALNELLKPYNVSISEIRPI